MSEPSIPQLLAKHLREVHFGGNWSTSCLRDQLQGLTLQQAMRQPFDTHSIATLTVHATYYVRVLGEVLKSGQLQAKDELSFMLPDLHTEAQWQQLQNDLWARAEETAALLEALAPEQLTRPFTDEKYGLWHRNILGIIEHLHYHLGQIALLRKIGTKRAT